MAGRVFGKVPDGGQFLGVKDEAAEERHAASNELAFEGAAGEYPVEIEGVGASEGSEAGGDITKKLVSAMVNLSADQDADVCLEW